MPRPRLSPQQHLALSLAIDLAAMIVIGLLVYIITSAATRLTSTKSMGIFFGTLTGMATSYYTYAHLKPKLLK